jgi:hypothetical protein
MSPGYWRKGKTGWSWREAKGNDSWPEPGYPLKEAQEFLIQGLGEVREIFLGQAGSVVAMGFVLVELFCHPARQKSGNLPFALLKALKWAPVEILKATVVPRSPLDRPVYGVGAPLPTKRLIVGIQRRMIKRYQAKLAELGPGTREAAELACLEKIGQFKPKFRAPGRRAPIGEGEERGLFEANLYRVPGGQEYPLAGFRALAKKLGFELLSKGEKSRAVLFPGRPKSHLLRVTLNGPSLGASGLTRFSLLESIKTIKAEPGQLTD